MLEGKVALVTGGSRGIGKAICLDLAKNGATVIVGYHTNAEMAEEVVKTIQEQFGGQAEAVQLDIKDYHQIQTQIRDLIQRYKKIDVLVNNAGIAKESSIITDPTVDSWREVIEVNLIGTFYCIKAVSMYMLLNQSGSIINISSVAGLIGLEKGSSYSASKAGIIGLTKSLSKEFASYNVRVNAVAPGYTNQTGMVDQIADQNADQKVPLRRFAQPEEIARVVTFLASDQSSYITGQTIAVDGGLSMVSV